MFSHFIIYSSLRTSVAEGIQSLEFIITKRGKNPGIHQENSRGAQFEVLLYIATPERSLLPFFVLVTLTAEC